MQTYIQSLKVEEFDFNPNNDLLQVWYNLNGEAGSDHLDAHDFRNYLHTEGSAHAKSGSTSAHALGNMLLTCPTRQFACKLVAGFMWQTVYDAAQNAAADAEAQMNYIEFEEC